MTFNAAILTRPNDAIAQSVHRVLTGMTAGTVELNHCLGEKRGVLIKQIRAVAGVDIAVIADHRGHIVRNRLIRVFIEAKYRIRSILIDTRSVDSAASQRYTGVEMSWPVSVPEIQAFFQSGSNAGMVTAQDGELAEIIMTMNWHDLRHNLWDQLNLGSVGQFAKLIAGQFHGSVVQSILGEIWTRLQTCGQLYFDEIKNGAPMGQSQSYLDWTDRHAELLSMLITLYQITKAEVPDGC